MLDTSESCGQRRTDRPSMCVICKRCVCIAEKATLSKGLEVLPLMLVGAGNVGHERRGILRALRLSDRKETPK